MFYEAKSYFKSLVAKRWPLTAGIFAVIAVSVFALSGKPAAPHASVVQTSPADSAAGASPSPAATTQVTVNGKSVPVDKNGHASAKLPSGRGHVEVNGGTTTVTNDDSGSNTSVVTHNGGNLNVNVQSSSNGGNSSSSTQVYGSSNTQTDTGSGASSSFVPFF